MQNVRAVMRRCLKLALWSLLSLGILGLPVIFGWITPFTPQAPATWHQIHVGMQRSNILALVGSPTTSGYPEKILETWCRDGAFGLRKLEVWYERYPDERASTVREYVYWRPSQRYLHTRSEP